MVTLDSTDLLEVLKAALSGKHPSNAGEYALHAIYGTGTIKDLDARARMVFCANMEDTWPKHTKAPVLDWIALSLLSRDPADRARIPRFIAIHKILSDWSERSTSSYSSTEDAQLRDRVRTQLSALGIQPDTASVSDIVQELPGMCPYSLEELGADEEVLQSFRANPSSSDRLEYYRFYTAVTPKFLDHNKNRVGFLLNGDLEHAPPGFEYAARHMALMNPVYWGAADLGNARELDKDQFDKVIRTWQPGTDQTQRILGISKHATEEDMITMLRRWCADRAAVRSRKGSHGPATPDTDVPGMSVKMGVLYSAIGRSLTAKEIITLRSEHAPTVISELPWCVIESAVTESRDELYAWALRWLGSNFDVSLAFSDHPNRSRWFHEPGLFKQRMHELQELWVSTATTVIAIRNEIADIRREALQILQGNQALWNLEVYYHIILFARARDKWIGILKQIDTEAADRLPRLFDRQVDLAIGAMHIGFVT